jgi:hypothetical protein
VPLKLDYHEHHDGNRNQIHGPTGQAGLMVRAVRFTGHSVNMVRQ